MENSNTTETTSEVQSNNKTPKHQIVTPITTNAHFQQDLPSILISLGLIFVFSYAAVTMSLDPSAYFHYVPKFMQGLIAPTLFLHLFAFYEVALSIWLLSGKFRRYSALAAILTICGITVFNLESFNVTFRNVSIILSALALLVLDWRK